MISLIINNWTQHPPTDNSYSANLEAGKKYKLKIEYYQGSGGAVAKLSWRNADDNFLKQAVNAAAISDVALVFVGTSDQYETEGKDRDDLVLPEKQDELINEVVKVNIKTIVILTTGSPVLMDGWNDKVEGILETWFAGEEIGNAVADVILGNYNPPVNYRLHSQSAGRTVLHLKVIKHRTAFQNIQTASSLVTGTLMPTTSNRYTHSATACRIRVLTTKI